MARAPLWSDSGVEPLGGRPLLARLDLQAKASQDVTASGFAEPSNGFSCCDAGDGYGVAPWLVAVAISEACRRPLNTTMAHSVAERMATLTGELDVDAMLDRVVTRSHVQRLRVADLARWLCRFGTTQRHVIGGLALLGRFGSPGDLGLIRQLGTVEPFAPYAVVAAGNLGPGKRQRSKSAPYDVSWRQL